MSSLCGHHHSIIFTYLLDQVGAKALAAMQSGGAVGGAGPESSQQFVVYPTMSGIPMVVAADLTKVGVV